MTHKNIDFSYSEHFNILANTIGSNHSNIDVPFIKMKNFLDNKNIYFEATGRYRLSDNDLIKVPKNIILENNTMFSSGNFLFSMGKYSSSNSNLPVNTIVGRYSSIADGVLRLGNNHPTNRFTSSMLTYYAGKYEKHFGNNSGKLHTVPNSQKQSYPIIIGNDVWIGAGVKFVGTGISVADGAIIGAESLVTKNLIEPYTIYAGIPAKPIKTRFSDEIIQDLIDLKWWHYDFHDFNIKSDVPIEEFISYVRSTSLIKMEENGTTFSDIEKLIN